LHKNVQELRLNNDIEFVFLPFHGSWLNQVEIWFSILNRKCVRRMDVKDIETGQEETLKFVNTWNINWSHPFKWEYTIDDLKRLLKIDEQIALPNSPDITA
jgi:transposase